ncbi:MAG: Mitochondrial inner membrane organizing system component [Claussenomyces sp. TS43310]|nr:MAG: Mitochondrial inner membrane organizing system component [Claussenomyces sp. TS43310]
MADASTIAPPPPPSPPPPSSPAVLAPVPPMRTGRPVSEALLNEKWDRCLSSLLIRSSLGLSFGVVFSVLLFKRRAWPAILGTGFGAGRAYEECNSSFVQGARSSRS